jgi:three-Cys-motif partner protein
MTLIASENDPVHGAQANLARSTRHRFGGAWTADKLAVLSEYLDFYTKALKNQQFKLVYIDAFAGTGRCQIRHGQHGERVIDGSAKIALDNDPPFQKYHFIEKKRKHIHELAELIRTHPNGGRACIGERSAADLLPPILLGYNWKSTRGVLFLDPYGLQCTWQMIEQVAQTRALDVFFLVSLSGLFRQAAVNSERIDEGKAAVLTRFLGTDRWRQALYTREQGDLFDAPQVTREPGYQGMLQFTTARLREAFPYVSEPVLLGQDKGAPLFALYFAVANPSKLALGLATKVSKEVLSKLR